MNILTFDIEDWYNCDFISGNFDWSHYEVRIYQRLSFFNQPFILRYYHCWIENFQPAIIGPKIPFKFGDDTIPGPGEYNPNEVNRPKSAAFSFTKSSERNVWAQNDMLYNPGPGQYNVIPELKKPKRWAEKLQVHPKIKIQRLSLKEEIRSM